MQIMLHLIWVFTVCQSNRYGVSSLQRVNVFFLRLVICAGVGLVPHNGGQESKRVSQPHTADQPTAP